MIMESKQRLIKLIKEVAFVAGILAANAIIYSLTGYGIPCVFRLITGLKCPGCGMTHAYLALLRGDVHGAAEYNLMSITVMPILIVYLLFKGIVFVRKGTMRTRVWEYILYTLCLIILILYFLYRNFYIYLSGYHH